MNLLPAGLVCGLCPKGPAHRRMLPILLGSRMSAAGNQMIRPLFIAVLLATSAALVSCEKQEPPKKQDVAVSVLQVHKGAVPRKVGVTGEVVARTQTNLSFRFAGRLKERAVDIGDHVVKGQLLAKLDPEEQRVARVSAEADLDLAKSQLVQATRNLERQRILFSNASTPRSALEKAEEAARVAQSNVDRAEVGLTTAEEQLSHAELRAKSDGTITAVGAEIGQLVQPAQAVFGVAEDDGRDVKLQVSEPLLLQADFNEGAPVEVGLLADPQVKARGIVREFAPSVDPSTGTVSIKIALQDVPSRMSLGATVIVAADARSSGPAKATLPAQALTIDGRKPAVWVVDRQTRQVSLRPVKVDRYLNDSVILDSGVEDGDAVVVAGVQLLHSNQTVAWE